MRKVSVLLSDSDEARLSAFCSAMGYKKSTLIAKLVREHLDREGFESEPARLFKKSSSENSL
jgi:predicted transcriptional regulator